MSTTAVHDRDLCWRCARYATVRVRSFNGEGVEVESELLCDDHAVAVQGLTYAPGSPVTIAIEKLS